MTTPSSKGEKKRTCSHCKETKPLEMFYHDKHNESGFHNNCKMCRRTIDRNSEIKHGSGARWNKVHKDRIGKAIREYNARNPEKAKARSIFHRAILKGEIIRQPCMICGVDNAHGHHDDYTKPLAVKWLCREHHEKVHTGEIIC